MFIEKHSKLILQFIWAIILIVSFFVIHKLLGIAYVFADDTDTALAFNFLEVFRHPANGIYTAGIPNNLFGFYLPFKFNIHPSVFKSLYFSVIETFIILGFLIIWTKIINKKFDYISVFAYIFSTALMFYFISEQAFIIFVYDGFFRMLFGAFWWMLLFFFFNRYINAENKKNTIIMALLIFLNTISGEFNFVLMSVTLPLYFVYSIFSKRKNLKSNLVFIFCVILGILVLYNTGTFIRKSIYFQNTDIIFSEIKDFFSIYFNFVIIKHILSYILLGFLIIYTNLKYKTNYIQKLTAFSIFTLIGIFIFFVCLIILGKTHMGDHSFWVVHADLHVMLNIIIYSIIFAFINYLTENKVLVKYFALFIFIIAGIFLLNYDINFYRDFSKDYLQEKKEVYIVEKILRTANCNNKPAFLNENIEHWTLMPVTESIQSGKLYETSPYITFFNQVDKNFNFHNGFIFADENKVLSEFKQNGGKITDEELKLLDFNVLYKICK